MTVDKRGIRRSVKMAPTIPSSSEDANFRNVFDANPDPIVISRVADGRIVLVNREFERASGYSKSEALGNTTTGLNLWADPVQRDQCFREVQAKGELRNIDVTLRMKDGSVHPFLLSAATVWFNDEACSMSVARNVSEQKGTQHRLEESERQLRAEIAEHRETEHRLRQSETFVREVIEASPDSITVTRFSDSTFKLVNEGFTRQTGLTADEVQGQPAQRLNLWAEPARAEELANRLLTNSIIQGEQVMLRRKDGSVFPGLTSAVLTEINAEQCVVSITQDITRLKQTENRLREQEETLRRILATATDVIAMIRLSDGIVVEVNSAIEMFGITREELLGKSWRDLAWTKNNNTEIEDFLRRLMKDSVIRNIQVALLGKDHTPMSILLSGAIVAFADEQYAVLNTRDITQLKEVERRLADSERTLRTIFESSSDAITINRASDGVYLTLNDAFLVMSGYTRQQTLGRSPHELGIWTDPDQLTRFLERLRTEIIIPRHEFSARRKNGEIIVCELSAVITKIGDEDCIVTITRDISELVAAREEAYAASKAKSEFLSRMSHEIRTPMNAIVGMAELVGRSNLTVEQRRHIDVIKISCDSLLSLINDILDLAKIESGRLTLDSAAFDVEEVAEKVAETMAVRAHEKGIELAVRVAPEVPGEVIGDALRLHQILMNLVGNAIKFTEKGYVGVEVACCEPTEDPAERRLDEKAQVRLRFSVTDTGIGIPADKFGSIFSSFEQADLSTTREYGGSGLGLAIVKHLVELYGGDISVESEADVGSCFTFTIVCRLAETAPRTTSLEIPALQGSRILVVGETPINRLIVRELLAPLGTEIQEATNYQVAVGLATQARDLVRPYKLVVVDCSRDGINGLSAILEMRRLHGGQHDQLPAIFMLPSDDLSSRLDQLRDLQQCAHLIKPIRRRDLMSALRHVIGEADFAPAPSLRNQQDNVPAKLPPMRVLLAEDSPVNRMIIREYLAETPLTLDEAENGQIAQEKFKSGRYDLVIMDMRMPVMDGYLTTRAIRAWESGRGGPRTPVIALTASALKTDADRCFQAGCDGHLSKPVKRDELLEAITAAVANGHDAETADPVTANAVTLPKLRDPALQSRT